MPVARATASSTAASGTSDPVCERAARTLAALRPGAMSTDRLAGVFESGDGARQPAPVRHVFCVDHHDVGLVVVAVVAQHVGDGDVGLIAEIDEPRAAHPGGAGAHGNSSPMAPLIETQPMCPEGMSRLATPWKSTVVSATPMQLGPIISAPAARTCSAASLSRSLPSAPVSPSPATIATNALTPSPSASSSVASNAAAGMERYTISGVSGSSDRDG